MDTMGSTSTTTVRLPDHIRTRLQQAAKATRRTRSSLMIEALELHLDQLQTPLPSGEDRYASLVRYKRSAAPSGGRSAEEISAILRDIRGDD